MPSASGAPVRRVLFASLLGATLEWYDFILYGVVAGIVFNRLYFPADDEFVSTMLAYATFAVGFLARPLGGIAFGRLGDKVGRKSVLVVTLMRSTAAGPPFNRASNPGPPRRWLPANSRC